jgi:3-hydroxyacyl-CoA dehydrogenase
VIESGRRIRRAAVLGAGVIGSQIAAQFANAGIPVLLFELTQEGADDPRAGARRAIDGLKRLHPSPIAAGDTIRAIEPAAWDLDLDRLGACDVVIEAVTERLDVKQAVFERAAPAIGPHAILASDTSGLSISELARGLPQALRSRFCGVHFFNPPRYMHLVELVAHPGTDGSVLHRLEGFLTTGLGKGVLYARDTPGFIGNRIGVFAIATVMHHAERLGLPFDLVDRLTGVGVGRQKSATFRTLDVIGLDTFAHILDHLYETLDDDPWRSVFRTPDWLRERVAAGAFGQKAGAGFYRKGAGGIEVFEPEQGDYRPVTRQLDPNVREALIEPDPVRKERLLADIDHPQAELIRASYRDLFHYCAAHLATLAPSAREVDLALRWGYGWSHGPFEFWQMLGWQRVAAAVQSAVDAGEALADTPLPAWARESRRTGVHGPRGSWSAELGTPLPRSNHPVYRRQLFPGGLTGEPRPTTPTLWQNEAVRLWDNGDDIAVLSFRRARHTVDGPLLDGMLEAIDRAEREVRALVLWQEAPPFCLGADLGMVHTALEAGDFAAIESLVERFQQVTCSIREAPLPVVGAAEGMALGGGLEFLLHCDQRVVAFETYAGLVESGVGLMPAGGGCCAMARRAVELSPRGDPLPWIRRWFDEMLFARVTGSGIESIWWQPGDRVVMHAGELLFAAKSAALALADAGYRSPWVDATVTVAGENGMAALFERLDRLSEEAPLSVHDRLIGERIAKALCGGEVPAGTEVDPAEILRLEREGFMALAHTDATAARIEYMLETGRRLRN